MTFKRFPRLAIGQFEEAIVAAMLSISEFPSGTGRLG